MTVEEAKTKLEALYNVTGRKYTKDEQLSIGELYSLVLDRPFVRTGCNDCFRDGVILALSYLRKNNKFKDHMEYTLRPGAVVRLSMHGHIYTNRDLTAEVAEQYIAMDAKNIRFFENYPSDYKERIANANKAQEEEPAKFVKRGRKARKS